MRALNALVVAAVTAIIILLWQGFRPPTQDERRAVGDRGRPLVMWREQSREAWEKLTRQRPSLSEVQFAVSVRDGEITVRLPKLSDEDELAAYRFILDHPPPGSVRFRRAGDMPK
jgi:hypothetical protein